MGNTWIVDMRHYLDEETGDLPESLPTPVLNLGLVENDGCQHLADPLAYRRDRRKDQLLQKNGYLVLPFLAEDVHFATRSRPDPGNRRIPRKSTRKRSVRAEGSKLQILSPRPFS